jgi:hypothetical protein
VDSEGCRREQAQADQTEHAAEEPGQLAHLVSPDSPAARLRVSFAAWWRRENSMSQAAPERMAAVTPAVADAAQDLAGSLRPRAPRRPRRARTPHAARRPRGDRRVVKRRFLEIARAEAEIDELLRRDPNDRIALLWNGDLLDTGDLT